MYSKISRAVGAWLALSSLCAPYVVAESEHHRRAHHRHEQRESNLVETEDMAIVEEHIIKRSVVYQSSTYPANAASATTINTPSPITSTLLGAATLAPAQNYLAVTAQTLPILPAALTERVISPQLTEDYAIFNGSGTLMLTTANRGSMNPMVTVPSYSRDQGKGGTVAGYHIFMFADTQSYTQPTASQNGNFTGTVSNSVAVDVGMSAAFGQPPGLKDMLGSMKGPRGQLRGFVPYTQGEAAYNGQNAGGSRYAIWPESSLIVLNPTTSLLYAPIIWQNISGGVLSFTQVGTTLCEVTVPSAGGPIADRVVPRLFGINDIQWGAMGGVRSFGPSGIMGGYVYIFGKVKTGLLLAKAPSNLVTNPDAYTFYYPGVGWNTTMPSRSSISCFTNGTFSAVDVFYSPRHLTFIMIFMDNYADNRIQWKYLMSPPILPTYAGGNQSDIAQYLTQYKWSQPQILVQIPAPPSSYAYGGGVQLGYFNANDISRGGTKMLLSWTWPNGKNAAGVGGGYDIQTAVVIWS